MPCNYSDLERGAVCLALYPFTTSFPVEHVVREAGDQLLAGLESVGTIDDLEATINAGDPPTELVARFKLRRVLVLHDGTATGIEDVAVARINSISAGKRGRERWYRRLTEGRHPTLFLIGNEDWHGTNGAEAYVDGLHVAVIPKATVLRRTGALNEDEMREVSHRLLTALEIDA